MELTKSFDENIKGRFTKICKICNHDINKFFLLLEKLIYIYKCIMIEKSLIKHHYLKRQNFHGNLNIEDISDADKKKKKKFWEEFGI